MFYFMTYKDGSIYWSNDRVHWHYWCNVTCR